MWPPISWSTFKGASVNYFGMHLKFGWNDKMLTVQRSRRDKEKIFYHGSVAIKFQIIFYEPNNYRKSNKEDWSNRTWNSRKRARESHEMRRRDKFWRFSSSQSQSCLSLFLSNSSIHSSRIHWNYNEHQQS